MKKKRHYCSATTNTCVLRAEQKPNEASLRLFSFISAAIQFIACAAKNPFPSSFHGCNRQTDRHHSAYSAKIATIFTIFSRFPRVLRRCFHRLEPAVNGTDVLWDVLRAAQGAHGAWLHAWQSFGPRLRASLIDSFREDKSRRRQALSFRIHLHAAASPGRLSAPARAPGTLFRHNSSPWRRCGCNKHPS